MHKLIEKLTSSRRADIMDALYELGGEQNRPDSNVIDAVISLINHRDADIREHAVNTAAIHWRHRDVYEILIDNFSKEKDQSVLTTMCAALGSLVKSGHGSINTVNTLLAHIILDKQIDPELRGTAYLSILRINNKISMKEYAAAYSDIENMTIDLTWLEPK